RLNGDGEIVRHEPGSWPTAPGPAPCAAPTVLASAATPLPKITIATTTPTAPTEPTVRVRSQTRRATRNLSRQRRARPITDGTYLRLGGRVREPSRICELTYKKGMANATSRI